MEELGLGPGLRLIDTTFRDGNQSLLGGHLRGDEIIPIAQQLDGVGLFSMEAFGGATFETALQLGDDPWTSLRRLREATSATPIQALIRGQNLVGRRNYADDTVELFVATAARSGIGVFRVFDPLNDLRNMEVAIRAARQAGARVQGALCYAVSPAHDLDRWRALAKGLAALEVDDVVIKDSAGLLGPREAATLVAALREASGLPVIVHSHCTTGLAPMAYAAAIEAGASAVDTALSPLAGGASQPAAESIVAALAGGEHDTGLDLARLAEVTLALEELRLGHLEHFSPAAGRIEADSLRYHVPALMLDDIQRQLEQHEAGGRLRDALEEVPRIRADLGFAPLVAPIRQLIAAQAVYNVLGGDRYATVSQELKDYLQGLYGAPPRPPDAELRRQVLGQQAPITIRPADLLEPQVEAARAQLRERGVDPTDERVLTYVLFPALAIERFQAELAPAEPAREMPVEVSSAASEASSANGTGDAGPESAPAEATPPAQAVAAEFDVEVEGEVFRVRVAGAGMAVVPVAAGALAATPAAAGAAPRARDGAVTAPMQGLIVKVPVQIGDDVKLGDVVAVLEAMKMQNDIVAPKPGKVTEVYVKEGDVVSPNQPLVAVG